jgi:hypothetical protein
MWIRSQDRRFLTNANEFFAGNAPTNNCIYASTGMDSSVKVGSYVTPERALEVLDEIQRIIIDLKIHEMYPPDVKDGAYWTKVFTIYQMPGK